MKLLSRTLVVFVFVSGLRCTLFNDTHRQRALSLLPEWTATSDEVAFATCDERWTSFDHSVLQNAITKGTVWSRGKWNALYDTVLENMRNNKRSAIVFPNLKGDQGQCLLSRLKRRCPLAFIDWIIFNDQDGTVTETKSPFLFRAGYPTCVVPPINGQLKLKKNNRISKQGGPVVLSRRCISYRVGRRSLWTDALNGATIFLACISKNIKEGHTSCDKYYFQSTLAALRHSNAIIIFKVYDNRNIARKEMRCGRADILMRPQVVAPDTFFSFPAVLLYARESFYAYSGGGERCASSFMVLENSQLALALLLISGVAVWLALSVTGCIATGTTLTCHVNWHAILDSATLTVSSLLSVSVSTIFDEARSRSRSQVGTTSILLAIWLLGTIPLLVYFRALLTSRLSVCVLPNPVDTLEELEAHLDSGEVQPCVVKGNAMHFRFTSNESLDPGIYEKLRSTYHNSPRKGGLAFDNFESCWKHCARKPGFVCIHVSSKELVAKCHPKIVASREHFGLHLASVPVRKDFPQMRALRNLMNRMFETGLYGRVNKSVAEGVAQNSNERLLNANEEVKAIKLTEFRSVWVCVLALYVFSFVVCCLEVITVHSKRHRFSVGRYWAKPRRSNFS